MMIIKSLYFIFHRRDDLNIVVLLRTQCTPQLVSVSVKQEVCQKIFLSLEKRLLIVTRKKIAVV